MGWLVPLYVAGLGALALPFLFHLVRRTPRGRQAFSSLMFLAPTPPRLTRRSRLDQLLLLSLRLLALALLALAFTRPFLRETAAFSPLDLPGRRVALLIDISASMRRGDLWSQAVRAAEAQLDDLNPQDDVALYAFDDRLERLIDFESDSTTALSAKTELTRQRLRALEPGWGATDLGTALVTVAGEMDSVSDVQQAAREPLLVVISDFQKGARIEALQGHDWPARVAVVTQRVVSHKTTNAVAHVLPAEEDDGSADARVRVVNAADSRADQFHLTWSGDPSRGIRPEEVAVYVPPGQSRVVRLPRTANSLEADRISLRGDDHAFDNTCFVVPPRKQQASLLYVGRDRTDDDQGMLHYLRLAVADDPWRQIEVQVLSPDRALATVAARDLRLIVLTQAVPPEELPGLRSFVEAGGTLLCVAAIPSAAQQWAAFFDGLEIQESPRSAPNAYLLLGEIDFLHPLFAPFTGPRYGDFTKIQFWKSLVLTWPAETSTRVVARFDNGTPALVERLLGSGRVLALSSGWNPENSQFAISSKFVPWIASLIDLACGEAEITVHANVHQSVALAARGDAGAIRVVAPGGRELNLAAGTEFFTDTRMPGIYLAQWNGGESRFAVNLAGSESQTAPLELEQLEQRGVRIGGSASRTERIDRLRQERDVELEGRQKVWRWLIAAAIGLLLIETWLAGRAETKLRSARPGEALG